MVTRMQKNAARFDSSKLTPMTDDAHDDEAENRPKKPPKTAIGAHVEAHYRDKKLSLENQQLKEQLANFQDSMPVKKLDASLIVRSRWKNRHEDSFQSDQFMSLKKEIESAGGNIQPIKVRPISGETLTYEIVFGHRRHQACLDLGLPVLALIDELSDQDLFIEMDRENRQRADLRPYEQGEMYRRALDEGLYSSMRKLATAIGIEVSNVSRAVALVRLPKLVLDSFKSYLDIQYRWSASLIEVLNKEPELILARANAINVEKKAGQSISSEFALKRLLGSTDQTAGNNEKRSIQVNGKDVMLIKKSDDKFSFEFKKGVLSPSQLKEIEKNILAVLSQPSSKK